MFVNGFIRGIMKNLKTEDISLSVCMVTYNHEKWISQAIEGVLMQKTTFSFELVIGEDCSTDRTREVVEGYAARFRGAIRAYYNKSNRGLSENFAELLNNCEGQYIAICEGDDFWTDPYKLQKQMEFLEANPDCVICSHNCSRLYETDRRLSQEFKHTKNLQYDQKRFLEEWVTQPLTCVFRNIFCDYVLFNKEKDIFCDVILFYELLKHGTGYFMTDNMAIFRVHQSALSSGLSNREWLRNHIIMFDYLYKHNKRDKLLLQISRKYCLSLYICKLKSRHIEGFDFKPLKEYYKRTPSILERIFTTIVRIPFYIVRHGLFSKVTSITANV